MNDPSMMDNPTKVMVAGDWHGSGAWAQKAIWHGHKAGAEVVVHLGDFGFWTDCSDTTKYLRHIQRTLEDTDTVLYWVDGNHEDHDRIKTTGGNLPEYPRIVYLPRGFRWEWHGKTWMALGGAHSVDRLMRTPGRSWWPDEHLSEDQVEYASRPGAVDVMVCHDCPDGVAIPGIHAIEKQLSDPQGFWPPSEIAASFAHRMKLSRVVQAVRPKVLYHGHYHVRYDGLYDVDGVTFPVRGLDMDATELDRNTMVLDLTLPTP